MDRFEDLRQKIVPLLRPYGIRRIGVFGSYARGEETHESDVDVLVEFEEPRKRSLGLFTWIRLEQELAERVGRRVDLVSSRAVSPHRRPSIEEDLVVLYEEAG